MDNLPIPADVTYHSKRRHLDGESETRPCNLSEIFFSQRVVPVPLERLVPKALDRPDYGPFYDGRVTGYDDKLLGRIVLQQ